ncbi:MAG: QueT transporter family protein [Bacillales bacterium]|jgi:uncharacterized membrane protein|nr:QueT transporter family protein [Bacillales bacterium]
MKKNNVVFLCKSAIVIALYVVLTLIIPAFSYGPLQFRIGELLILLVFYNRKYAIPLIMACLFTNIFSPFPLDILFGTLGTIFAVLLMFIFKKNIWLSSLMPTITNALFVTIAIILSSKELEWSFLGFLSIAWTIALSEFIIITLIGVPLFLLLRKQPKISKLLEINDVEVID